MKIKGHIKGAVTSTLQTVNRGADRVPAIRRWQQERFLANAKRFTPALGVDDERGNRFFIRSDDLFVGGQIFMNGSYEVEKVAVLDLLAERGFKIDQILDVGANIGTTTIEFLSRDPKLRAAAFEPEPVNFGLLRQNIFANGLADRVTLHQVALSDEDGEVNFEIAAENPGDHRVRVGKALPGELNEDKRSVTPVKSRRLDTLIKEGEVKLTDSTLLCMDIQGHEAHALDGATKLRKRRLPVLFELWPYGLHRSGGFDRLVEQLAEYDELFLLAETGPKLLNAAEFQALAADLGRDHTGALDLLAI